MRAVSPDGIVSEVEESIRVGQESKQGYDYQNAQRLPSIFVRMQRSMSRLRGSSRTSITPEPVVNLPSTSVVASPSLPLDLEVRHSDDGALVVVENKDDSEENTTLSSSEPAPKEISLPALEDLTNSNSDGDGEQVGQGSIPDNCADDDVRKPTSVQVSETADLSAVEQGTSELTQSDLEEHSEDVKSDSLNNLTGTIDRVKSVKILELRYETADSAASTKPSTSTFWQESGRTNVWPEPTYTRASESDRWAVRSSQEPYDRSLATTDYGPDSYAIVQSPPKTAGFPSVTAVSKPLISSPSFKAQNASLHRVGFNSMTNVHGKSPRKTTSMFEFKDDASRSNNTYSDWGEPITRQQDVIVSPVRAVGESNEPSRMRDIPDERPPARMSVAFVASKPQVGLLKVGEPSSLADTASAAPGGQDAKGAPTYGPPPSRPGTRSRRRIADAGGNESTPSKWDTEKEIVDDEAEDFY